MSEVNGTRAPSSRGSSPAPQHGSPYSGSPQHVHKFASKHIGHVGQGKEPNQLVFTAFVCMFEKVAYLGHGQG